MDDRSLDLSSLPQKHIGAEGMLNSSSKFKHIIYSSDFDLIWWEGMRNAMESYQKMFCIFITKQVSGWCGSNSKQSL
jgi:hypothetical protein